MSQCTCSRQGWGIRLGSATVSFLDLRNQLGGVELKSANEVDKLENIQPPFPEFHAGKTNCR